jgi:2-(1,2-epoxy-1,2-dihydrophenyl)acetyl-CoA isomerase
LIWKVVDDDKLAAEVEAVSDRLASAATHALALTKRALAASSGNALATQLDLERELQKQAGASADGVEGVNAFLEKRAPRFSGEMA